jgi:hypothetical protein
MHIFHLFPPEAEPMPKIPVMNDCLDALGAFLALAIMESFSFCHDGPAFALHDWRQIL